MDQTPDIRASDADRDEAVQRLHSAFANGQLDYSEFDERAKAAYAATYRSEFVPLLADLVPSSSNSLSTLPVDTSASGDSFSLALMGGVKHTASWYVAKSHFNLSLMGGSEFDFREATLTSHNTNVVLVACMGGTTVLVPETVQISCNGIGLMGGFSVTSHPSVTNDLDSLPADAPLITFSGLALMGGVEIIRIADGVPYHN